MKTWTYVLIFSNGFMTYDEAKNFLNARDDIKEWLHVFENFFLFVSDNAGSEVGNALIAYAKKNQGRTKPEGLCLVMEVSSDRQGLLLTAAWNLMNYQSTTAPKNVTTRAALKSADDLLDEEEIPF